MQNTLKRSKPSLIALFVCCLIYSIYTRTALAQSVKSVVQTKYSDHYELGEGADVAVTREIELTNKTNETSITQYEIAYTNFSLFNNYRVYEDNEQGLFEVAEAGGKTIVSIPLKKPLIGKGAVKKLKLVYLLRNYLHYAGVSRELFIPLTQSSPQEELTNYLVSVQTPSNYPKLGISKPRVKQQTSQTYLWEGLEKAPEKTLYLSFSDRSYYQVTLNYTLENPSANPRLVAIPFVPDGIFQKMYLEKVTPEPENVSTDADDNYLATYLVPAKSTKRVVFNGYVELFTQPRNDVREYWRHKFNQELNTRYLTLENYWSLSQTSLSNAQLESVNSGREIYNYVVQTLSYDSTRINQDLKRMGAEWTMFNPTKAVCMEYTDLFIALARERGIPARSVVGYAVTLDQAMLPLSFLGDVLHAWPERYDRAREIWIPLDPTWGDTAGLDYYSSFDLSHISFVYHGKDPSFPLPPGVYKIDPRVKDVNVVGVETIPQNNAKVSVEMAAKVQFSVKRANTLNLTLISEANHFLYNQQLSLKDKQSGQVLATEFIPMIEPLAVKKVRLIVPGKSLPTGGKTYTLSLNDQIITERAYTVQSSLTTFGQTYGLQIGAAIFILVILKLRKWH